MAQEKREEKRYAIVEVDVLENIKHDLDCFDPEIYPNLDNFSDQIGEMIDKGQTLLEMTAKLRKEIDDNWNVDVGPTEKFVKGAIISTLIPHEEK